MDGDPVDPISFERALREMWEQLAARVGINLRAFLAGEQASSSIGEFNVQTGDEVVNELREEAKLRLMGLIIVEELKCWTSARDHWHRPTPEILKQSFFNETDQPIGLYVDRQELTMVTTNRWPGEFGGSAPGNAPGSSANRDLRKRGRPRGSGTYSELDAPLLVEMHHLISTGQAMSLHAASMVVAEQAPGGGSCESKARRLRDAYVRKRGPQHYGSI